MARSECARCKIMFTSVAAFDAHLLDGGLTHVNPADVPSLVQRANGIWGPPPMTAEALARLHRGREPQTA